MSDLNRLRELAALLRPKQEPVVEEASNKATSDFEGIKRLVDEAIGDLEDKLGEGGALETLLDKHGLSGLDKNDDKDGAKMLERLDVRTKQYKKEVESILLEIELMLASAVNEGLDEAQWSGDVDTKWEPAEGFFKKSADDIASGLKRASKDLKQAMSRLNFYINRAGKNLSTSDAAKLSAAKEKLHSLYA